MKFKCIVEYEYPIEHKPPVKADIYLHGDKVATSEIKSLQAELEDIKVEIQNTILEQTYEKGQNDVLEKLKAEILEHNRRYLSDDNAGLERAIWEFIEPHIEELKGEEKTGKKEGRWKKISPAGIYECTCCGQDVMTSDIECYKFCHGCGARMEG